MLPIFMMLDPNHLGDVNSEFSSDEITFPTATARNFAYVPDINALITGDLVLTEPIDASPSSKLIQSAQAKRTPQHARWTHAAVYAGGWSIIQSNPKKGIHVGSLLDYVPTHNFLFRRIGFVPPNEQELVGTQIALQAALRMPDSQYDYVFALQTWLERFRLSHPVFHVRTAHPNYHICSTLYDACVTMVTGRQLQSRMQLLQGHVITPAVLAGVKSMQDVRVRWARIV